MKYGSIVDSGTSIFALDSVSAVLVPRSDAEAGGSTFWWPWGLMARGSASGGRAAAWQMCSGNAVCCENIWSCSFRPQKPHVTAPKCVFTHTSDTSAASTPHSFTYSCETLCSPLSPHVYRSQIINNSTQQNTSWNSALSVLHGSEMEGRGKSERDSASKREGNEGV